VRLKYFSCAFMNFHVKISNFQSSFFSKFRCEIKVFFVRFHELPTSGSTWIHIGVDLVYYS
jgi:hypothetical protein